MRSGWTLGKQVVDKQKTHTRTHTYGKVQNHHPPISQLATTVSCKIQSVPHSGAIITDTYFFPFISKLSSRNISSQRWPKKTFKSFEMFKTTQSLSHLKLRYMIIIHCKFIRCASTKTNQAPAGSQQEQQRCSCTYQRRTQSEINKVAPAQPEKHLTILPEQSVCRE